MLKKYLYHGSFAALGISLLLGMAILQANGLKTSNGFTDSSDDQADATPATDTSSPATTATPAPSDEVQVAELPAAIPAPEQASSVIPEKIIPPVIKTVPAPVAVVPEGVKDIPLNNIQGIAVYDSHRKQATRKAFTLTPNNLRKAITYYRSLANHYGKRATVQAKQADGTWATISAKSFKQYVTDNLD